MTYLIIGASGFLGGTIYKKLLDRNESVVGTCNTHQTEETFVKVDLFDADSLLRLYDKVKPDVIIWTVRNYEYGDLISRDTLVPFCQQIHPDCRFVFLSTSIACEPDMDESVQPLYRTEDMYLPHYFNGTIPV